MPSPSEPSPPEIAERLLGAPPERIVQVTGGGNSRVFRVTAASRDHALKLYPPPAPDRDRRVNEWAALKLLTTRGVDEVPRAEATDPEWNATLLEWIDGAPVPSGTRAPGRVDAALAFVGRLRGIARADDPGAVGAATEACLSLDALTEQIERRLARLETVDDPIPRRVLGDFPSTVIAPALNAARTRAAETLAVTGRAPGDLLPRALQTLSPSDFGFHNALAEPGGRLRFIDFEYFGWDDPVKLTADFLLHPGMSLTGAERDRFRAGALEIFGSRDPGFAPRLDALTPLYAIRWALIVLNEFLPERWAARVAAGETATREAALDRQLTKARSLLGATLDGD